MNLDPKHCFPAFVDMDSKFFFKADPHPPHGSASFWEAGSRSATKRNAGPGSASKLNFRSYYGSKWSQIQIRFKVKGRIRIRPLVPVQCSPCLHGSRWGWSRTRSCTPRSHTVNPTVKTSTVHCKFHNENYSNVQKVSLGFHHTLLFTLTINQFTLPKYSIKKYHRHKPCTRLSNPIANNIRYVRYG